MASERIPERKDITDIPIISGSYVFIESSMLILLTNGSIIVTSYPLLFKYEAIDIRPKGNEGILKKTGKFGLINIIFIKRFLSSKGVVIAENQTNIYSESVFINECFPAINLL